MEEIAYQAAKRTLYALRQELGHEPTEEEKHQALLDLGIADFYTRHRIINHRRGKWERVRLSRSP